MLLLILPGEVYAVATEETLKRGRTFEEANMYKYMFRISQNTSVKLFEACVLASKCDKSSSSIFRLANRAGVKELRTCSARLCEKSDAVSPSKPDGDKHAENKSDQKESLNEAKEKAANESLFLEADSKREETSVLMTDNGSTAPSNSINGTDEPAAAIPKKEKAKSGKESLLDLLGAMKVDVTSKRKVKKTKQEHVSTPKPRPAPLESTISMFQNATVTSSPQSETLDPELVAAASAAASTLPNSSQAESELLQQLRQHETITEAQKKGDVNSIGVIIADMKVGKNLNRNNARPANQIRFDDDGRGYTLDRGITGELDSVRKRRNLFTAKRLNIFSPPEDTAEVTVARPTLWDMDFANQLSTLTNQMPRNGLDEMIHWTKQGKMWQYPINNEAGLEGEASIPFHEHVFLEKHLEEGFPHHGPVRHFMELVIVGLSRNPYLTVQQKKEHIFWFRDYFSQKEEVLKEDDFYLS